LTVYDAQRFHPHCLFNHHVFADLEDPLAFRASQRSGGEEGEGKETKDERNYLDV